MGVFSNAYDEIISLTEEYNNLLDGKWNYMMDYKPRNLPVFHKPDTTRQSLPTPGTAGRNWVINPTDGKFDSSSYTINELGYSREALSLEEGDTFAAKLPSSSGALNITLEFIPNHPVDEEGLEVEVDIEGEKKKYLSYETYDRSEEWKNNVLRNQALRTITIPPSSTERIIKIKAATPAVILDRLTINSN